MSPGDVQEGYRTGRITEQQVATWHAMQKLKQTQNIYELEPDAVKSLYDGGAIDDRTVELYHGLHTNTELTKLSEDNAKLVFNLFTNSPQFTFAEAVGKATEIQDNESEDLMGDLRAGMAHVFDPKEIAVDVAFGVAESLVVSPWTGPYAPVTAAGVTGINVAAGATSRALRLILEDTELSAPAKFAVNLLGTGVTAALLSGGVIGRETMRTIRYRYGDKYYQVANAAIQAEYKRNAGKISTTMLNPLDSLPKQPDMDSVVPQLRQVGGGDDVRLLRTTTPAQQAAADVFESAGVGVHFIEGNNAPRIWSDGESVFVRAPRSAVEREHLVVNLTGAAVIQRLRKFKPELFERFQKVVGEDQWNQNVNKQVFWNDLFEADAELAQALKSEMQLMGGRLKSVAGRYKQGDMFARLDNMTDALQDIAARGRLTPTEKQIAALDARLTDAAQHSTATMAGLRDAERAVQETAAAYGTARKAFGQAAQAEAKAARTVNREAADAAQLEVMYAKDSVKDAEATLAEVTRNGSKDALETARLEQMYAREALKKAQDKVGALIGRGTRDERETAKLEKMYAEDAFKKASEAVAKAKLPDKKAIQDAQRALKKAKDNLRAKELRAAKAAGEIDKDALETAKLERMYAEEALQKAKKAHETAQAELKGATKASQKAAKTATKIARETENAKKALKEAEEATAKATPPPASTTGAPASPQRGSGGVPEVHQQTYGDVIRNLVSQWDGTRNIRFTDDLFLRMEKNGHEPQEIVGELLHSAGSWVRANRKNPVTWKESRQGAREIIRGMKDKFGKTDDWESGMVRTIEGLGGEMKDMSYKVLVVENFVTSYEAFIMKRMKEQLAAGDAALNIDLAKSIAHLDNMNRALAALGGMTSELGRSLNILKMGKMRHAFDFDSLSTVGKTVANKSMDRKAMRAIMEKVVSAKTSAERIAMADSLRVVSKLKDALVVQQMMMLYRTATMMVNLVGTGIAAGLETGVAATGVFRATGRLSDAMGTMGAALTAGKAAVLKGNPLATAQLIRKAMKTGNWDEVPQFWKTLIHRESEWNNFNSMHEGYVEMQDRTYNLGPLKDVPLGYVVTIPGSALQATDDVFKTYLYNLTLNKRAIQTAVAAGKQGADLDAEIVRLLKNPSQELVDEAVDAATYGTFQKHRVDIHTTSPGIEAAYLLTRLTYLPFIPTLFNLVKYSADTLLGPAINKQFRQAWSRNDPGVRAELLARLSAGWGLFTSGIIAGAAGVAQGYVDPDKRNAMRSIQVQEDSVEVGGESWSFGKLEPAATVFSLGVNLQQEVARRWAESGDPNINETELQQWLARALIVPLAPVQAVKQTLYSRALAQPVRDLFDNLFNPDSTADAGKLFADQLMKWRIGLMDEAYEVYGEPTTGRWTDGFLDKIRAKIWPESQAKFVHSLYGTDIEPAHRYGRVIRATKINTDPLVEEYRRLDILNGPLETLTPNVGGVHLENMKLEPNDAAELNHLIRHEELKAEGLALVNSESYKRSHQDAQRSALLKLRDKYREDARQRYMATPRGQEIVRESFRRKLNTVDGSSNPDGRDGSLKRYTEGYGIGL